MPFARPTLPQLIDTAQGDIETRLPGADARLPRSNLAVLATVLAGGEHGLYGYLAFLARQIFPDQAEAEYLERWTSIWGIARKQPSAASGSIALAGNNGTTVPAGTLLQRSDGAQFSTGADATIAGGIATAPVTAVMPGSAGNTPANSPLTFVNPIAGIASAATVSAALSGGADIESDDALRGRLLQRIQQPPQGGAANDYIAWALAVPGVTRAWAWANWMGPGTVGVTFVLDDNPISIIPQAADVAAVEATINAVRPVTAQVSVFAPVPIQVPLSIHLNPGTTAAQRAASAQLADLFAREAIPGGTIYLSHIREAVATAAGVIDSGVAAPGGDVVMQPGQIAMLGPIAWI